MIVCLNGTLVDAAAARIDPADRGFTLGDGVFETMAVKNGQPRRLAAHLARLRHGAHVLGIPIAASDEELATLIAATAAANELIDAVARLTLSRGAGGRGIAVPAKVQPTLLIAAAPVGPPPEPVNVVIALRTRRNEHSPLSRIKSLNCLDSVIARQEAVERGADDAILLNGAGRVAEAAVSNICLLLHGGLVTPPVSEGALPGVTRADLIAKFRAEERPVTVEDLTRASEVFLTNALGARAVLSIDGKPVGDGEPGLITTLLAARL